MPTRHYSRLLISLILAAALLAACARPGQRAQTPAHVPGSARPGDTVETLSSAGVQRQYRQHIPPSYQDGQALPLVINLHGYNSNATQQEQVSRMSAKADAAGFIVVYPEGLGQPQSWKFGDRAAAQADVSFIRDLIRRLHTDLGIDPKRIYVTGISNGAEMSYRLACDLGDTIAAFAPVAGGYPPFRDCQDGPALPVVAFHGTEDQLLPYDGHPPLFMPVHEWAASWAARNACATAPAVTLQRGDVTGETWSHCRNGADVVLYTIAGKGHSWPGSAMPAQITTRDIDATDVIWDFFASHPKP